ncbi:hypothetical protein QUE96_10415 [Lactococcus lactis]|jgi:hypothetical protein|nr:hypothetical protein [Lactococcus lactis]MDM7657045.1 hypothetical protein [Lactococcus lactis]
MDFKNWKIENKKKRNILKRKEEEIERKYLDNFDTKKNKKLQYLSFLVGGIISSISLYYYISYKNIFSLIVFILVFNGLTSNILKTMMYFKKKNSTKMKNKNLDKIQSAKARGFQCLVSFIAFIGSCVSLYYFVVLNSVFCLLLFILFFNRFVSDLRKIIKFFINK